MSFIAAFTSLPDWNVAVSLSPHLLLPTAGGLCYLDTKHRDRQLAVRTGPAGTDRLWSVSCRAAGVLVVNIQRLKK